jgi:hypothetical protein
MLTALLMPSLHAQVFTQVSFVLLLWGTMCGGLRFKVDMRCMLACCICSPLLAQVFTQISFVLLLMGTMCGSACFKVDMRCMLSACIRCLCLLRCSHKSA